LFRGTDDAYADELIKNAEALYEFAETYKGKYSDSVPQASPFYTSWSGYNDELALGGVWLYRATGDKKYLSKAENYFKIMLGT
jgi:endoglucanase